MFLNNLQSILLSVAFCISFSSLQPMGEKNKQILNFLKTQNNFDISASAENNEDLLNTTFFITVNNENHQEPLLISNFNEPFDDSDEENITSYDDLFSEVWNHSSISVKEFILTTSGTGILLLTGLKLLEYFA